MPRSFIDVKERDEAVEERGVVLFKGVADEPFIFVFVFDIDDWKRERSAAGPVGSYEGVIFPVWQRLGCFLGAEDVKCPLAVSIDEGSFIAGQAAVKGL